MRLSLPVPPSANTLYANARKGRVKSGVYNAWIERAGWQLKAQRPEPIAGPVLVRILAPENNRRDIDNVIKPAIDLLVLHELIEGDRCKTVRGIQAAWHDEGDEMQLIVTPAR